MSCVINIYSIKVNSISGNGSVNMGPVFHNSHTANTKATGGNTSVGDQSPTFGYMNNQTVDPDVNDQNEYGNLDSPIVKLP